MSPDMTFREAIQLFRSIYQRFEKLQDCPWGVEGAMIELSKQVGELAKLVMVSEGYYFAQRNQLPQYQASQSLIGDELADVFAQLIRIADYYQIDLVEAHVRARQGEEESLDAMGA